MSAGGHQGRKREADGKEGGGWVGGRGEEKVLALGGNFFLCHLELDLHVVQVARDQAIAESLAKAAEIAHLQSEVDRHLGTIAECREQIQEDETIRRKLHNSIQELKGVWGAALSAITPRVGRVSVWVGEPYPYTQGVVVW